MNFFIRLYDKVALPLGIFLLLLGLATKNDRILSFGLGWLVATGFAYIVLILWNLKK